MEEKLVVFVLGAPGYGSRPFCLRRQSVLIPRQRTGSGHLFASCCCYFDANYVVSLLTRLCCYCCSAGKGTQCELVRKELGWSHVSAGDLLRAQVAAGTEVVGFKHTVISTLGQVVGPRSH